MDVITYPCRDKKDHRIDIDGRIQPVYYVTIQQISQLGTKVLMCI